MTEQGLSGWGRYPVRRAQIDTPRTREEALALIARRLSEGPLIARGLGRAYGDAALAPRVLDLQKLDRFLSFHPETGRLVAEAGVSLGSIIDTFLPRGWFPAVVPGTRFVTLGGAIAADVHGKNHHRDGSFGAFVERFELVGPDGVPRWMSRAENPALFESTLGGMGLTGVILTAEIRLRRVETAWIVERTLPAQSLMAALEAFEANLAASYSVAWIDTLARGRTLGRALVHFAEHAPQEALPKNLRARPLWSPKPVRLALPCDLPAFALKPWVVRAFNALYWQLGKGGKQRLVPWRPFFFPLDSIEGWNRAYGRQGFVQFQCVLPLPAAREGLSALLDAIAAHQAGSFLAVLKRFGPQYGRLSFPTEGYTLALDFPVTPQNFALLDRLEAMVSDFGGRFYLAKDARLTPELLRRTDPRMEKFAELRHNLGFARTFVSDLSTRLAL